MIMVNLIDVFMNKNIFFKTHSEVKFEVNIEPIINRR